MGYYVIVTNTLSKLEEDVAAMVKGGYKPQGGIFALNGNYFMQAMFKEN